MGRCRAGTTGCELRGQEECQAGCQERFPGSWDISEFGHGHLRESNVRAVNSST